MNNGEFGAILDVKLANLNDCVEKIDLKLDRHLDWHHEESESARKNAEAAVIAVKNISDEAKAAARAVQEARRWDLIKMILAPLIAAAVTGGIVTFFH